MAALMLQAPVFELVYPNDLNAFANSQNWQRRYYSVGNKPSVKVYFCPSLECIVARILFLSRRHVIRFDYVEIKTITMMGHAC